MSAGAKESRQTELDRTPAPRVADNRTAPKELTSDTGAPGDLLQPPATLGLKEAPERGQNRPTLGSQRIIDHSNALRLSIGPLGLVTLTKGEPATLP